MATVLQGHDSSDAGQGDGGPEFAEEHTEHQSLTNIGKWHIWCDDTIRNPSYRSTHQHPCCDTDVRELVSRCSS